MVPGAPKESKRRLFLKYVGVSVVTLGMAACKGDSDEEAPPVEAPKVEQNSNAVLKDIKILSVGYDKIRIFSE